MGSRARRHVCAALDRRAADPPLRATCVARTVRLHALSRRPAVKAGTLRCAHFALPPRRARPPAGWRACARAPGPARAARWLTTLGSVQASQVGRGQTRFRSAQYERELGSAGQSAESERNIIVLGFRKIIPGSGARRRPIALRRFASALGVVVCWCIPERTPSASAAGTTATSTPTLTLQQNVLGNDLSAV